MCYFDTYLDKAPYRVPAESGYDWVSTSWYNMFRINRDVFDKLHNMLTESYGLKSTMRMSSVEALGPFLWIVGAPQSMRQAKDYFVRSTETCSRKFEKVLRSVSKLAAEIIRPLDPEFSTVHQRLQSSRFSPYFDNCIGAIDGTYIKVAVPTKKVIQQTGRKGYTSRNVMAICDFDIRFTFVFARWPGSVHDTRMFKMQLQSMERSSHILHKLMAWPLFHNVSILCIYLRKSNVCRKVLSCGFGVPNPTRLSCTLQGHKVSSPKVSPGTNAKR
jgi:hypothetical protein